MENRDAISEMKMARIPIAFVEGRLNVEWQTSKAGFYLFQRNTSDQGIYIQGVYARI